MLIKKYNDIDNHTNLAKILGVGNTGQEPGKNLER